jgi:hypothetical protein
MMFQALLRGDDAAKLKVGRLQRVLRVKKSGAIKAATLFIVLPTQRSLNLDIYRTSSL